MTKAPDEFFIQKTIARPVAIAGIGIHSGTEARLELYPAPVDSGIRFQRTDRNVEIAARVEHVSSLVLATTLGKDGSQVSTVEHLLAAALVLGIDNLTVKLDGPEVPILDGSALPYYRLLAAAGLESQSALRKIMAVTAPLEIEKDDGRGIRISPYPGLRITYCIDFEDGAIGAQSIDLEISPAVFERELAPARTFALLEDVHRMHERGLGLGGNESNCVVFDEAGPINTALRFADEPVRHKALDALGDLALMGVPIWGHLEVERGGHALHVALIEALQARRECWTWMAGETVPLRPRVVAVGAS